MKICIINFSGRRDGNCHDIAVFIEQTLAVEHEVMLFEMCNLNINPCGKCDYECFYKEKTCPHDNDDIVGIYDALCSSDLAYYIIPNYIDYPNAYFFMFSERKQGYFASRPGQYLGIKKKFVVVSNTGEENFRQILSRHVLDSDNGDFLFMATKDFDKGNARGGMMESEKAKEVVRGFC